MKTHKNTKLLTTLTLGTAIEWFEFTLFAYLSGAIASYFFPHDLSHLARVKVFALFACSYITRPLGALIFGHIGDVYGRHHALFYSMLLMALSTVSIALIPSPNKIGSLAPYCLLICRCIQGLSIAGEFNGAAVTLLEQRGVNKPFLQSAWVPISASFGMLLGNLCASTVHYLSAIENFWKIPFILCSLGAVLAVYLRRQLSENIEIVKEKREQKSPIYSVIKEDKLALLFSFLSASLIALLVYLGNIYFRILIIKQNNFSAQTSQNICTLGQLLATIGMIYLAFKIDAWNGKKFFKLSLLLTFLISPFIFICSQSDVLIFLILGQIIYAILNALLSTTVMPMISFCFEKKDIAIQEALFLGPWQLLYVEVSLYQLLKL